MKIVGYLHCPILLSSFNPMLQRQKEMVKMLYNETMALEELLEEAVNTLGPDARDILAQIRYAVM